MGLYVAYRGLVVVFLSRKMSQLFRKKFSRVAIAMVKVIRQLLNRFFNSKSSSVTRKCLGFEWFRWRHDFSVALRGVILFLSCVLREEIRATVVESKYQTQKAKERQEEKRKKKLNTWMRNRFFVVFSFCLIVLRRMCCLGLSAFWLAVSRLRPEKHTVQTFPA